MEGKINVEYKILEGCINSLKTITDGEDVASSTISEIDNLFQGTKSKTAMALKARQEELKTINNLVNSICVNSINVLETANTIYKNEDEEMTNTISNAISNSTVVNVGES